MQMLRNASHEARLPTGSSMGGRVGEIAPPHTGPPS